MLRASDLLIQSSSCCLRSLTLSLQTRALTLSWTAAAKGNLDFSITQYITIFSNMRHYSRKHALCSKNKFQLASLPFSQSQISWGLLGLI